MKQIDRLTAIEFKHRHPEAEYTLQTSEELFAAYGDTTYWAMLRVSAAWKQLIRTIRYRLKKVF